MLSYERRAMMVSRVEGWMGRALRMEVREGEDAVPGSGEAAGVVA
jgi:hypothetical protein